MDVTTTQLVVTLLKAKSSLSSIGSSPLNFAVVDVVVGLGGNSSTSNSRNKKRIQSVKGDETDDLITKVQNSWLYVVASVGVLSGVTSLYWIVGNIVDFASLAVCCIAPYTVYQKYQLKNLGSMRYQQNRLRTSVNEFHFENVKLSNNVTQLETDVTNLKNVEKDLQDIVTKTGGNVDRLVNIIQTNGELQLKIKENLESSIMQSILTAVLVSDINEDFTLNPRELKRVETRLSNIPGVKFDKKLFRDFVGNKTELQLNDIMTMLRNLKESDGTIPTTTSNAKTTSKRISTSTTTSSERNIFTLIPEKM